jgi:radical SAM superfamily enzyme YgiQ (UPF0313 family)
MKYTLYYAIMKKSRASLAKHGTAQVEQPQRSKTRVLLCSVFGPYEQDDSFGSRKCNPMELYHNQITRVQGPFSLRMFHRSWGLMLIQANINAKCTLLDFPDYDRFIEEIRTNEYDIIGISAIYPNFLKVKEMCKLIRDHQPNATIIVGGHISNVENLKELVDADHIAQGDGVRWFREFLGEDTEAPINHPVINSGINTRCFGVDANRNPGDMVATVIPSVGCPMSCEFCSTSAMFQGKGKFINFYETGDEIFEILCELEKRMGVKEFFIMDENFLLYKERAIRLLELIEEHDKSWAFDVFSSANALIKYTTEQLVRLGISWVWIGLESEDSTFAKLKGVKIDDLIKEYQSHGISFLGSSIIGLDVHTPENMDKVIDYAVHYDTDFHQFMLYTALPGTPLFKRFKKLGILRDDVEKYASDSHGQFEFNYEHPHIKDGKENEYLIRAFTKDFEVNGPSIARMVRTKLMGWKRYKNHPDARIRKRFEYEMRNYKLMYSAVMGATVLYYKDNPALKTRMQDIQKALFEQFGFASRLVSAIGGRYVLAQIKKEEKRLAEGLTYEPPTFYEKNFEEAGENKSSGLIASQADAITLKFKKTIETLKEVVPRKKVRTQA